ncbi:hypothetical protein NNJEOMEG_01532 [Fundidesulfovibrio magnetotacticus]|uniref:FecR protein domain-containing protein n=1 Tax=Fundidesulfovibrio magnetotacticus TaxID=2730080 RepID=A0A6V8LTP6_9BACT|nr:FecR domain-containing protein [Fundidesulfovibrio magnetotacticus]GFK93698.1 hypothetical protein NNJEOMEG_01532 [Fundidesulfovibrio magnetotacticus]
MKRSRHFAILTCLALVLAFAAVRASAPAPAGTVEELQGQAQARQGEEAPRKLAKGAPFFAQDVVTTPTAGDKLRLAFADGSSLDVGPESQVALKDFAYDEADKDKSKQVIAMGKGMFRYVTGKVVAQNPDNLKIQSPLAVVGIRGTVTDHWVKYKPNGELDSELHALRETKSGTVVTVRDAEGKELSLDKPGQTAWVRPNLPGAVRQLSDDEMQSLGKAPIKRSPFDPPARASFSGGAN